MSDKLKKFINEHRQEFDDKELSGDLWNKIDARMDLKSASVLNRHWFSKYKLLAFGASVFVAAVFFVAMALRTSSDNESSAQKKELVSIPGSTEITSTKNPMANKHATVSDKLSQSPSVFSNDHKQNNSPTHREIVKSESNPVLKPASSKVGSPEEEKNKSDSSFVDRENEGLNPNSTSTPKQNENFVAKTNKKPKLYIPVEPKENNTYTGTLYEGSSFRALLRAYKFPGKFNIDEGGTKTISCSHLEKNPNIKAIWLKGRTNKEIVVSVKRKFKNVVLIKSNGREVRPEAISHYYRGLGVISEFRGKAFNMLFKDKVELILFFKDAEPGDKISIDGIIKAVVIAQP